MKLLSEMLGEHNKGWGLGVGVGEVAYDRLAFYPILLVAPCYVQNQEFIT